MKKLRAFLLLLTTICSANTPRVSIITSCYNGDEFIAGFLSDITRQTIFHECELIIINANSPGNEEPIILEYAKKHKNIVYKKLDHDPGLYAVWNMAIKMAHADFITNANLDDRRNPESLEIHAKALDEDPTIDLVYSDFYVTFTPNETFECNTYQYVITSNEFSKEIMYRCITGPQPMWRKNVHEKCDYFDETYVSAGDFEMWNRAAHAGSKFKKIPGLSGLYYFNPNGISTAESNKDIQKKELDRITNIYASNWSPRIHYYCTAADSNYFSHLLNLIGSIHKLSNYCKSCIAVFDLGLTTEQKEQLQRIGDVSIHTIEPVHPDILKWFLANNKGKKVPGWYAWKFVVLKQALDIFPYVLWLDAGTTVLRQLDDLFDYIQYSGYFLSTMGDEKFYNQLSHPISWGTTEFVKYAFNLTSQEYSWVLNREFVLSNTIGISRKSFDYLVKPLYNFSKNLRLFEDDGTTPNGFGTGRHDQTILSIYAYLHGLHIHIEDYTQNNPMYLSINGNYAKLYITWNGNYVNENTHIYNSRWDLSNYDEHIKYIKYRE